MFYLMVLNKCLKRERQQQMYKQESTCFIATHVRYIWRSAVRDTNQDIVRNTGQEANNQGYVKVMDVTLEEVGVSSKMKATENTDGSYGVRRRISTHKRRSGSCRR